jgi:hypothetical protein
LSSKSSVRELVREVISNSSDGVNLSIHTLVQQPGRERERDFATERAEGLLRVKEPVNHLLTLVPGSINESGALGEDAGAYELLKAQIKRSCSNQHAASIGFGLQFCVNPFERFVEISRTIFDTLLRPVPDENCGTIRFGCHNAIMS